MKLSIVIICWNDLKVIMGCLESIYKQQHQTQFEVIVSDNGSTDGSVAWIRSNYPQVRVLENGANLGFAKANNVGIRAATGEYVLILNPDTICHDGALDKWMKFADAHPEAGAYGCRVHNPDQTFHEPAQLFPTVRRYWFEAVFLHKLGRFSEWFSSGEYKGWDGTTERTIDWQSGCCVLFRADVLAQLNGFDERFFYNFEEVDLCKRVWDLKRPILYTPEPIFTHLWGQSVKRFPIRFALEKLRNRYRYFWKHFGPGSMESLRAATLTHFRVRRTLYSIRRLFGTNESLEGRLAMYKTVIEWNKRIDLRKFIEHGEEPDTGYEPLAPAPQMS